MYSFIATADNHLGKKLYNELALEQDNRDSFGRICELAILKKVDYLVIAGDLFESNNPSPENVEFVGRWVKTLELEGIATVGITGDHDKNINTKSWMDVTNIIPVDRVPQFGGCDYSDNQAEVISYITQNTPNKDIEWLFLHAQVPSLFKFTTDKKKLDLDSINLFVNFPSLKGVILGDIHAPVEQTIICKDRQLFIGYCSSPVIGDIGEALQDKRVLWFDGKSLHRIPVKHNRLFIQIDFTGFAADLFDINKYMKMCKDAEHKPVILVEYDSKSEHLRDKVRPLYDVAIVKESKLKVKTDGTVETVNIRSELQTKDRIPEVFRQLCPDKLDYDLAVRVVTEDPKVVLDEFRSTHFKLE